MGRRRSLGALVTTRPSRYRSDAAVPDYSHRFHAGNVGDVWKHAVLVAILSRLAAAASRVVYVESHAGEGAYALASTGEWTEGIGRLWNAGEADDLVTRYVALARRLGAGRDRPERYPGSPLFARAALGPDAELRLWERDPGACASLRETIADDARVTVRCDDGLDALETAVRDAERDAEAAIIVVDPPWTQKADWTAIPDVVARAAAASRHATIMLWYPLKSLTRPNAMMLRLRAAGVAGTLAELVTTPLEHQRRRLNGSGVVLIRPPADVLETIGAAAPVLGARCAVRPGVWSYRMSSWQSDAGEDQSEGRKR